MREIEVKAKVIDKKALLDALAAKNIILGEPKKQHDVVYSRPGAIDNPASENWLRIRTENDVTIYFTLKRSVTNELDSIEHEVTVSDASELARIIHYLGYELFSDLTKIRQKAKVGEIEICVDELPGYGTYIEAERMVEEDADYEAVTAQLWGLLEELGISRENEETRGYDVLTRAEAAR